MAISSLEPLKEKVNSIQQRSFGGCATCRRRHVKCDEQHPTCSTCSYIGLECAGYEKAAFFEASADAEQLRFRRPVQSERERKRMSQWLVSSVPPTSTFQLLSQIDDESSNDSEGRVIQHGPFGVFRVERYQQAESTCTSPTNQLDCFTISQHTSRTIQDFESSLDGAAFTWTDDAGSYFIDYPEQLLSSLADDVQDMGSSRIEEVFDDAPPPTFQTVQMTSLEPELDFSILSRIPISTAPIPCSAGPQDLISQDALILLRHYTTNVINLMTPFRHTKTPWHVLFIPQVKSCLASLALGENIDHSSQCTFYGTLAFSALSLGGISQSQTWFDLGKTYEQIARENIKKTLDLAYSTPKVMKYKSVLMALLTMIHVSSSSGNRDEMEHYFLEAEKFIRLKGLKRQKSRKVRLLHHCYAFERMFHESTMLYRTESNQRHHVRKAVESSGVATYSRDSLSFRFPTWTDLDREMLQTKSQEEGENDLHVEKPGVFSASLYPEIFGMPETWINLLSLVIRLGREKDTAGSQNSADALSLKDFVSRAKAIERRIINFPGSIEMINFLPSYQSQSNHSVLENMLNAMQVALEIYFYRRIYDVDASILQHKVVNVFGCLLRCEHADPGITYGSAGFIWPAFIAACEAEAPEVQVSFSTWFKNSAQRSGLSSFSKKLQIIEQIWQQKQTTANKSDITWLDLTMNDVLLR